MTKLFTLLLFVSGIGVVSPGVAQPHPKNKE